MIASALGIKRIFIFILFVICLSYVANWYYFSLEPERSKLESELSAIDSEMSKTRKDLAEVSKTIRDLQKEKTNFDLLFKNGFFEYQDRITAGEIIKQIQKVSSVISLSYTINPALLETNSKLNKAEYLIINSPINLEINALSDLDIYNFMYLLQASLPGSVSVKSFTIKRHRNVDDQVLRSIISGKTPLHTIVGELEVEWRTMIPSDSIDTDGAI